MECRWAVLGKARRIGVACLAVFGALQLFVDALRFFIIPEIGSPPTAGLNYSSPDGKYKAVMFQWDGGAAMSSYCLQYLSVVPATSSDFQAWQERNRVVESGCGGIKNVTWKSERMLEVALNPAMGVQNIRMMKLGGFAEGIPINLSDVPFRGNVEIAYTQ